STVTRAVASCVPPGPLATSRYVVDWAGLTVLEPFESTLPMPSMETSLAFSVRQVSCVDCPAWMESGLAESDAVGAAGGGGGGGGGVLFLAQPASSKSTVVKVRTRDCRILFFTSCLQGNIINSNPKLPFSEIYRNTTFYFQLQLG